MKGSTDSTEHLSPNVRLLLRADTIFMEKPVGLSQETDGPCFGESRSDTVSLCHYPGIIAPRDYFHEYLILRNSPPPEINPEKYVRHTKIEKLVKKLLADMGMPEVARVVLDTMKTKLACGGCAERTTMTWVRSYVLPHHLF